jgi:hypothetical protein
LWSFKAKGYKIKYFSGKNKRIQIKYFSGKNKLFIWMKIHGLTQQ